MNRSRKRPNSSIAETSGASQTTYIVGIGASAGGLEAIESFFKEMPPENGLTFIVIQHLSPDYKSLMVELLSKKTEMNVLRAEDGMTVEPNHVYLIPPKMNMTIFHGKLFLKEQNHNHGINLPIDVFLHSLAEDQAENAIAVILSGTGSDGTRGIRAIKENNGLVMVQDEDSAKFNGMPRSAISTGLADFILPPSDMPKQLLSYAKHLNESRNVSPVRTPEDQDSLSKIFAELREKTRVDFTYYKPSTVVRRIERRITVCQVSDIDEYVHYLYRVPGEVMTLYRELLIGVTSFFRDPDAMALLMDSCIPQLLTRVSNREVRFWVAGCSTGEEAYTLAIQAKEVMELLEISRDIKIFATDIDRDAIAFAGAGVYPESITADLAPRLISKYFYKKGETYQIARNIREMVVFAKHNLVKDPPFTNIDLVSCRNLLIYLQPVLQQKALQMFNFSLNQKGILFLGSSETIGEMNEYFTPVHQKFKIYESTGKLQLPLQGAFTFKSNGKAGAFRPSDEGTPETYRRYLHREDLILSRLIEVISQSYIPLTVVVNEHMEVLYTIGNTEGFFKIPAGRIVLDITKMASKDLAIPLSTAIQKAFKSQEPVTYNDVHFQYQNEHRRINLKVLQLPDKKNQEALVAVFIDIVKRDSVDEVSQATFYDIGEDAQQRIKDLDNELQFVKENLQATIEELETSNEELQATNEELLASNEELQSTNEELQSTNEELYTVNSEYQNKINELTESNNDVDNLLTCTRIGKLLLDEDLCIRKYSPEICNIFLLVESDIGRPIYHLVHKLVDFNPLEAIKKVQTTSVTFEKDVTTTDGITYLLRIIPYSIGPHTFSGVVASFVDVTKLKKTESDLDESRRIAEDIIHYMPSGLFIYSLKGDDLIFELSNPEAQRLTGISTEQCRGKTFDSIWTEAKESGLTAKFKNVLTTGISCILDGLHYKDNQIDGHFHVKAFRLPGNRLAVSFEDISVQMNAQDELKKSEERYSRLFQTVNQGEVEENI